MVTSECYLSAVELRAMQIAIARVNSLSTRADLLRQVDALSVRRRTEKTTGYYADFDVPVSLKIVEAVDEVATNPLESEAVHPDGTNAIFFMFYLKDGLIAFMEAASTAGWPLSEAEIRFQSGEPSEI